MTKPWALALLDVSVGEFFVMVGNLEQIDAEMRRFDVQETIIEAALLSEFREKGFVPGPEKMLFSEMDAYEFDFSENNRFLCDHFEVLSLDGFGCRDYPHAVCAAGALLRYAVVNLRHEAGHVNKLELRSCGTALELDPISLRNLEIVCSMYDKSKAGSLLGVADHVGTGFPVGKVDRLDLYPMSFREFLVATDNEALASLIEKGDWPLINTFASDYIHLLRTYFYVGGMPEAVDTYISTHDYTAVRDVQLNLLSGYRGDFSKHAPSVCLPNMNLLWESIPQQLAKENKRFVYSEVQSGARRKTFEYPLRWLQDAGLIHPVPRIKTPKIPMSSYWAAGISKVFFVDVGLLGAVCELDAGTLLDGNLIFDDFKGALTEQYVQQELRAACSLSPCYWASEEKNAKAEIDFLCSYRGNIVPIEVKSGINTQAKSLKTYCQRFQPKKAIRTSLNPHTRNTLEFKKPLYPHASCEILDIPLFAISRFKAEIDS